MMQDVEVHPWSLQGHPRFSMKETQVRSLDQEDLLEEKWQPTPILLPGEYHGQRSPSGYSSLDLKELNTTELLNTSMVPTHLMPAAPTHQKGLQTLPTIPGNKFTPV